MFATPSLYTIYGQPPRLDGALVIGISQSGASPDVVAVLAEAREQGRPTLALTNDVESPLAQTAEAVLPLEAGREQAVAATKTYVNSLGAVALLFAEMGDDAAAREELARMPEALAAQIELSLAETPSLEEYRDAVGLTVVARGVNYGTGFEIALKIRELSGIVTEAYSPADLMHGPIAAIQPGWPSWSSRPAGPRGRASRRSCRRCAPAVRGSSRSRTSVRYCAGRRRSSCSRRASPSGSARSPPWCPGRSRPCA